jgi:hypothetical protein
LRRFERNWSGSTDHRGGWGSCSTAGRVTFDTDLLTQPAAFRHEVIVHELLHLKVPNHGRLFKAYLGHHRNGDNPSEKRPGRKKRSAQPDNGQEQVRHCENAARYRIPTRPVETNGDDVAPTFPPKPVFFQCIQVVRLSALQHPLDASYGPCGHLAHNSFSGVTTGALTAPSPGQMVVAPRVVQVDRFPTFCSCGIPTGVSTAIATFQVPARGATETPSDGSPVGAPPPGTLRVSTTARGWPVHETLYCPVLACCAGCGQDAVAAGAATASSVIVHDSGRSEGMGCWAKWAWTAAVT